MKESREIEDDAKLNKIKRIRRRIYSKNANKRRRNSQNENRNFIPNIVNKVFFIYGQNIRSAKMVESAMARLLSQKTNKNRSREILPLLNINKLK